MPSVIQQRLYWGVIDPGERQERCQRGLPLTAFQTGQIGPGQFRKLRELRKRPSALHPQPFEMDGKC